MDDKVNSLFAEKLAAVDALKAVELVLYFQPKLEAFSEQVVGFEALIRGHDAQEHLLMPGAILPHLQAPGLQVQLGQWVRYQVFEQQARWHALTGRYIPVAINVADAELDHAAFADEVLAGLARFDLPADALVLEVSAPALHAHPEALAQWRRLDSAGVRLSVDAPDCAGESLQALADWPVRELKFGRRCVSSMEGDVHAQQLCQTLVREVRAQGLRVVAAGIETDEQRGALLEAGCDYWQGFLNAPAMPAGEALEHFLDQQGLHFGPLGASF